MTNAPLDVITFEVMSARLDGIVREMENAGGLPASIHGLFGFYAPADMREGDAFLASHPYHSGCPHANDMVVMTPVFWDGALVAFAASIGHTPDIGGVASGSRNATARDLFGEGLLIPPVRFMCDYRLEQDTATFVRANSRVPQMMIGDLTAKAGVCHTIGEARLHDLINTYGTPALLQQFDQAGERTAHRISEQLAAWPDGVREVEAAGGRPQHRRTDTSPRCLHQGGAAPRARLHRHR